MMRSTRSWAGFAVVVLAVLAACAGRARPGLAPPADPVELRMRELGERLRARPDDREAQRELAILHWTARGDVRAAGPVLERLAAAGDPLAATAVLTMAAARLHEARIPALARPLVAAAARADAGRLADGLAEHAARVLVASSPESPRADQAFVALLGGVRVEDLPFAVAQPLLSHRAALARRRGEDYRPYYERQGCVQRWQVGPVEGEAGALELGRFDARGFVVDPGAEAIALSCVVRLWNPTARAAIRRMRSWVQVAGRTLVLDFAAEHPSRLYLDGVPIVRTDRTDRWPAGRNLERLEVAPGAHEIVIATTIPDDRAWVLLRTVDGEGRALAAVAEPPRPTAATRPKVLPRADLDQAALWPGGDAHGSYAAFRAYLALEARLSADDTDGAEHHADTLRRFGRFAEGQLLLAAFEAADPSRGKQVSSSREQAALEAALAAAPELERARQRILQILIDRGDEDDAREQLRAAPRSTLRGLTGELLRFRVNMADGSLALAEAALARARAIDPDDCRVLSGLRMMARRRDDTRTEGQVTDAMAGCSGTLELRARFHERLERWEPARALWEAALERTPDDVDAALALADLEGRHGRPERARTLLEGVLRRDPFDVRALGRLADLAAAAGDRRAAAGHVAGALRAVPHSSALHEIGETVGIADDLLRHRVSGRDAIAEYRRSGVRHDDASEVYVLDRSVAYVYENGGQRQIIHFVIELLSKDALDRYGEVVPPEDGQLLTLHSIKADGSIVEPELVPGKDGLSLRGLEVGDMVEYEYVIDHDPETLLPGYVDVSTFRFQSFDAPFHRSELVVIHPEAMPIRVDARNGAPLARERVERGWRIREFVARRMPRLGVEPAHRDSLADLPNVRVYTALALERWADSVAVELQIGPRTNPELRALAGRLVAGIGDPRARVRALWSWIGDNVEDGPDLRLPATITLSNRRGNRLMLMLAMARTVGLPVELRFVRDVDAPAPLPGGHPMVEQFEAPLLTFELPGGPPLQLSSGSDVVPLGYVAPVYAGGDAVRIQLDDRRPSPRTVAVAGSPVEHADARRWQLTLVLEPGGGGRLDGRIELRGMEAILWRRTLRDIDRDRIEQVFAQAELQRVLPGAELTSLKISHERELDRPLVLEFVATAARVGSMQGDDLVLPAELPSLDQAGPYATLPRRRSSLLVPIAPLYEAELEIRAPGGRFTHLPAPIEIRTPRGSYVREVRLGEGGRSFRIRRSSTLVRGVVEPGQYDGLADLARRVGDAERDLILVRFAEKT